MWRVGGGLALAHVVLLFAGFSQEVVADHGTSAAEITQKYGAANLNRVMTGGYIQSLSFLALLAALVFASNAIGQRTEVGRWAARTSLAAGVASVASTLAVGMPAGAAALYGAQHGADAHSVLLVNDIRNYAFHLQVATATSLDGSGRRRRCRSHRHCRGALFQNVASMAWIVWWVGMAVTFLRVPKVD